MVCWGGQGLGSLPTSGRAAGPSPQVLAPRPEDVVRPGRVQRQLLPWGAVLHDRAHDHLLLHPAQRYRALLPASVAGRPSGEPHTPPQLHPCRQAHERQGGLGWHRGPPSPLSSPGTRYLELPESANAFEVAGAAPAPSASPLQGGKGLPASSWRDPIRDHSCISS